MKTRDDFSLNTKRELAERVAFRCSFRGCDAITVGPSTELVSAVSNTGMACHIAAAAGGKGARRYVSDMTAEQRSSFSNGIWMCYTHGKLIDTDEIRFTIEMLRTWKGIAEKRAQIILANSDAKISTDSFSEFLLVENSLSISKLGNENITIGQALKDSCIPLLWGEHIEHILRDFAVEICRNSLTHGNAKNFKLNIKKYSIEITDDGNEFDSLKLNNYENKSGGTITVKHLVNNFDKELIITSQREVGLNKIAVSFVRSIADVSRLSPCSHEFNRKDFVDNGVELEPSFLRDCSKIYLILPEYYCPSDIHLLRARLKKLVDIGRSFVFVTDNISPFAQEMLLVNFPGSSVLLFKSDKH